MSTLNKWGNESAEAAVGSGALDLHYIEAGMKLGYQRWSVDERRKVAMVHHCPITRAVVR